MYLDEEDTNNVRILSHKLKGVAANLRVEDAFEVLTTVNTSEDLNEIRKNLDYFYLIIAKLNGEEPIAIVSQNDTLEDVEDELILDFKDDTLDEVSLEEDKIITPTTESKKDTEVEEAPLELTFSDDDTPLDVETDTEEKLSTVFYDKDKTIQELGIQPSDFDDLLSDYKADTQDLSNQIRESISTNKKEDWNKKVTKLKGMSESMKTYHLI